MGFSGEFILQDTKTNIVISTVDIPYEKGNKISYFKYVFQR